MHKNRKNSQSQAQKHLHQTAAHLPYGSIGLLLLVFWASGATSLVYETLWARQLHLVFGTSQLAISTVLAAFMAGLALGGFSAARWADRLTRPLLVYAFLEAGIGLYAVAFPFLIQLVSPIQLAFWRSVEPSPSVFGAFQFVTVGLLLLPPTMCMGATLPLLTRFISSSSKTSGETGFQVGRLYGANTLGAVIGTALAGFVLLPQLGLSVTTWWTAAANGVLALGAAVLSYRGEPVTASQPVQTQSQETSSDSLLPLFIIAGLAGFTSLLCEVAWFRLLSLMLGGSAYAFSLMLLAFLLGIGIGGWGGGWGARRSFRHGGTAQVLRRVAWLQIGVASLTWAAMHAYSELPFVSIWLYTQIEHQPGLLWPAQLALALAIMLPPAVLMGASFPYLVQAATGPTATLSRIVGRLYGVNTLGAIAGAAGGGLVFLPLLQMQGTVLLAVSCNILAAVVAGGAAMSQDIQTDIQLDTRPEINMPWVKLTGWGFVAGCLFIGVHHYQPHWDPLLMTSGPYKYVSEMEDRSRQGLLEYAVEPYELLFYEEGLSSVVTVARDRRTDNIWLANNGKVDASTQRDIETQVLLAHLPFIFRPLSEKVLVIGFASGISAGSVTLHQAPQQIDIVELEPAVVAGSHAFDTHNHRPLDDPRVHLHLNDARNHLLLTPDGTYDIASSEPSNPWLSGVSNLFTQEFFALGKRKLRPGGVWVQWVQTYGMIPADVRSLLATFADVYGHVRLFRIDSSDLVLVGSDAELPLQIPEMSEIFLRNPAVAQDLAGIGFRRAEDILSLYQFGRDTLLQVAGTAERNTDDNMRIEYSAPLHLHEDTSDANTKMIQQMAEIPLQAAKNQASLVALARAYATHDWSWRRALTTIEHAVALNPDNPRPVTLQRLYRKRAQRIAHRSQ